MVITGHSGGGHFTTRWRKFCSKGFTIRDYKKALEAHVANGPQLSKVLGPAGLLGMGVGCIVGSGIYVITGAAAHSYAGPGIILSYAVASVACCLSAFCYAEFACDIPLAGGAFNFITYTMGEFPGWIIATNLFLEYTLANAAVAKGFTSYFASLAGLDAVKLQCHWGPGGALQFDWLAALFVAVLTGVSMKGMQDSRTFSVAAVAINISLILFVVIMGVPQIDADNYHPFLPYGAQGMATAASIVFFSYIGFDTVATLAEEVKNTSRDLPVGIVGSLGIATVLYILMCATITGMTSYEKIDINAPFAEVFKQAGMGWAATLVAVGALCGINTALLGSLTGQARIFVTLGRAKLLPDALAVINERTHTPLNACIVTGVLAALLGLVLDLETLSQLVSVGTLFVFCVVCAAVLWRRYYLGGCEGSNTPGSPYDPTFSPPETPARELEQGQIPQSRWAALQGLSIETPAPNSAAAVGSDSVRLDSAAEAKLAMALPPESPRPVLLRLLVITVSSSLLSALFHAGASWVLMLLALFVWAAATASFLLLPIKYKPAGFNVPLVPFFPSAGMLINLGLIGSLGLTAYVRWAACCVLATLVYWFYSMHRTPEVAGPGGQVGIYSALQSSDEADKGPGASGAPGQQASVELATVVNDDRAPLITGGPGNSSSAVHHLAASVSMAAGGSGGSSTNARALGGSGGGGGNAAPTMAAGGSGGSRAKGASGKSGGGGGGGTNAMTTILPVSRGVGSSSGGSAAGATTGAAIPRSKQ